MAPPKQTYNRRELTLKKARLASLVKKPDVVTMVVGKLRKGLIMPTIRSGGGIKLSSHQVINNSSSGDIDCIKEISVAGRHFKSQSMS